MATKKKTSATKAKKAKPGAADPLANQKKDAKAVRDLAYAWLYVTVGQIHNVTTASSTKAVIAQLTGNLKKGNHVSLPAGGTLQTDITNWVTKIRSNDPTKNQLIAVSNLLKGTATATSLMSKPWNGPSDHPDIAELDSIFVND
jgi:hypothetical protein